MRCTFLSIILVLLTVAACKPSDVHSTPPLTVCVAASLEDVVGELINTYESRTDTTWRLATGASGTLRKQIELGAPCDVFVSSDPLQVDVLNHKHLTISHSTRTLATNQLVLAQPVQSNSIVTSPTALVNSHLMIAIASPDVAPAGRYAKQALERLGIWTDLQSRLVRSDNVRMAAKQLSLRAISAAIVYATDANADNNISVSFTFPEDSHDPIEYVGCVVAASSQTSEASQFVDYLASQQTVALWRKHGFAVPKGQPR